MKKVLSLVLVLCMLVAICAVPAFAEKEKVYTIATVVKLTGVAWFDRMEVGVNQFAEDTGMDAFQTGHSTGDPAEQVRVIEDLIAQGVDALCVVPNSTESLETVLKKARDAGIVVVTHEAADVVNADFDIEAFDNTEYGRHFMDILAPMMGEEGQYTTFVGSLTATSHNQWVDGSNAVAEEKYPNMEVVSNKNETTEDQDNAYAKTKELLLAYPELKGFQGSAMTDVVGVGHAIEEAGKQDSTFVIGTGLCSTSGQYIETGAIDAIAFWDPALAGYAMNEVALKLLKGEEVVDGVSLEAEGYQNLTLDGIVLTGSAWIDVTKDNYMDYDF